MNDKRIEISFDEMHLLVENMMKQAIEKDGELLRDTDDLLAWLETNENGTIELDIIDLGDDARMRNTYFRYD